jgi:DICT domain-containing protein
MHTRPVLAELEGLMEDSVISMANLSDFEIPKELSEHSEPELGSDRELEVLKEFEEYKTTKASTLKQEEVLLPTPDLQSTTGQSTSGEESSNIEEPVFKHHLFVNNPLFRFEHRPDILDVLY